MATQIGFGFLLAASLFICWPYGLSCYKPVVLMHGLNSDAGVFSEMIDNIQRAHPGTNITAITAFSFWCSFVNIWHQVERLKPKFLSIMNANPEGIHLICYSQGGMICRALLQTTNHSVNTFISLSAPLSGQFGIPNDSFVPDVLKYYLYQLAYTQVGQLISVADYWNDPYHQEEYRTGSTFLAVLNNQSTPCNPSSLEAKRNFLLLKRVVLIGGPNDGEIIPWQSSQFAFYNDDGDVVEMSKTDWYIEDSFGLRTLDRMGSIIIHTLSGVQHKQWPNDKETTNNFILPYLT